MLLAMTSPGPWWGSALITLAGVVSGAILSQIFGYFQGRRERRQQSDSRRRELYEECHSLVGRLLRVPVWPAVPSATPQPVRALADALDDTATRIPLYTDMPARQRARQLATAATHFVDTVEAVRANTDRRDHGAIHPTARGQYEEAGDRLEAELRAFTAAARRQLGMRS